VVIPARDEERYLGACLSSLQAAAARYPGPVETIVVLNRCRDRTEAIARRAGARIVREDAKNLAAIRNAGARVAQGGVLITVDADSRMSPNMLCEVGRALGSGRYIGGGVPIRPERWSLGILAGTLLLFSLLLLPYGISGGLFWCRREDFEAIGGFNRSRLVAEDVDFARRLKAHGKEHGKRFKTLWRTHIVTSCRKFDRFGDWFLMRHPRRIRRALRGCDRASADRFFYDFPH
jgi:glycosyltransferase involved in cell wall biosynthesis